jgi:hypothetical protein
MGFFKDFYDGAKEIGWNFVSQQTADVKKFFSHLPFKISSMIGGVRDALTGVLSQTREKVVDKPIAKLKKNRDDTKKFVSEKIDELTLTSGAESDESIGGVLQHLDDTFGASQIDIIEGKLQAEKRKKFSEWTKKKALPMVNRRPPTPLSDADVIQREERDLELFDASIKAESDPRYAHHNSVPDEKIASSLVHLINGRREGAGLTTLRLGKNLTSKAARRSKYKLSQIQNKSREVAPLEYLETPPIRRLEFEEEVPVSRYRSGYPQFRLTQEKRKRLVPDSISKIDDGSYRMKFYESDEDYASRVRETRAKREHTQPDDFSVVLDFDEGNYPFDGDPYVIMDKALEKAEHRLALMGEKNEIGIGITREGSKVVVNFLLKNSENPEPDDEIPLTPLPPDDAWWMELIPDDIREPEDDEMINFQELYDLGFDSWYSLYQLYLFSEEIKALSQGHDVEIIPLEFHAKEKIHSKPYDLLHLSVRLGKQTQVVKLVKGTNLVDIPEEETTKKDKSEARSVGKVIPLEEYFEKIKDEPEPKSIRLKYKKTKKKEKEKEEEDDEEELFEEDELNNLLHP